MKALLGQIKNCKLCSEFLPCGPRPVIAGSKKSRIMIIGQAPGRIVHKTGIPWNDKSGENLRSWLGVSAEDFYDTSRFALVPMGFCYPGTGKSGDLPPRKECAPLWHPQLMQHMPELELILLVGQYAQRYYLGKDVHKNLTETVANYSTYLPRYFPLPHPSPRNNIWQARHPWFRTEVLPSLREHVHRIIGN